MKPLVGQGLLAATALSPCDVASGSSAAVATIDARRNMVTNASVSCLTKVPSIALTAQELGGNAVGLPSVDRRAAKSLRARCEVLDLTAHPLGERVRLDAGGASPIPPGSAPLAQLSFRDSTLNICYRHRTWRD